MWDPLRPLPGLHEGSWESSHPDRLLLLGKGKDGPAARAISPQEVVLLLHGKRAREEDSEEFEQTVNPSMALAATPRSLAKLAVRWGVSQIDSAAVLSQGIPKVGTCALAWERETEEVLLKWIAENPPNMRGNSHVGGGKKKGKNADLPQEERAMKAISYVLRHAAGTQECPISEEGWVKWDDLVARKSCQRFGGWTLWNAIEADAKNRVIAKPDQDGVWWVAAWSGHTQERVIGPSAQVPSEELPEVLVHGSYRQFTASIQKKGLLRQRRDLHFHDPKACSEKWRIDLETRIDVDVKRAVALGCKFRKTGNDVWLCATDVPPDAIIKIGPWDHLGSVPPAQPARGSQDLDPEPCNSARIDLSQYRSGSWQPKVIKREITEEIAVAIQDLGKNLPGGTAENLDLNLEDGSIKETPEEPEARFAPGLEGEELECDWSGDEVEVQVIQAEPAAGGLDQSQAAPAKVEMKEETSQDPPEEPTHMATTEDFSEPKVGGDEPVLTKDVEKMQEPESKEEIETLPPKTEEQVVECEPRARRPRIRFGSAHLHLLKAVADADAANWESLQEAIQQAPETARVKSELVDRLAHLAELRVQSRENAEKKAQEYAAHAKQVSEAETEYRKGLNEEMLRLEKMNPVGPRTEVPLVSDARLKQEIAAGKGIWQARRDHRARLRAAKHRQERGVEPKTEEEKAGPLTDVDPEKAGEALDDAFKESSRRNLKEFRAVLQEQAQKEVREKRRQPDSQRRKQVKRQRQKEKKANSKDDADRDRNHAIAHPKSTGSAASISPGAGVTLGLSALTRPVDGANADECKAVEVLGRMTPNEQYEFDLWTGVIFDVLWILMILLLLWIFYRCVRKISQCLTKNDRDREGGSRPAEGRKVGGTRKRVKFNLPRKGKKIEQEVNVPFLGGPKAALRKHPPGKPLRIAAVQGRQEFEQEGFSLLLSRYSQSTAASYQSQWGWWSLFCKRRGEDPVRYVPAYSRKEEQLVIDYLVHCSVNETKAPGTIKLRLSAIRSMHLTLGYPDPLAHMPRVPLALAGLRRRFGTKERRMPVTPEMLKWLGDHLQLGKSEEASLLWGALTLGFFFLLRASEYLDVGYQDPKRGFNGKSLGLDKITQADEVTLLVRGSKTDIYNRGQMRNHFLTTQPVCVVKSMIQLFHHFPQRYQGGSEAEELLFRTRDDRPIPRAAIQALIERASKALGLPGGDLGTHSLRFGGASAL